MTLEFRLSTEQKTQVASNLYWAINTLYNGGCVEIIVPDYGFGMALVKGDEAVLKEAIEQRSAGQPAQRLNSRVVEFLIVDFTSERDPQGVLAESMSKIPDIRKIDPRAEAGAFNRLYPGRIMAIIGAENVPQGISLIGLGLIARTAPTAFIHTTDIDLNRSKVNSQVLSALGENSVRYIAVQDQ